MRQRLIYTSKVVARLAPVALVFHTVNDRANCATFSAATYPANDPIEDRHLYRSAGEWSVAAVFDGHGGWQVSDFASQSLVDKVLQSIGDVSEKDEIRIDERIQQSFEAMEHEIIGKVRPAFNLGFGEVAKVGSCVLLALRRADRLVVANCGDCRAILGTAVPSTSTAAGTTEHYVSTRITRDHNARVALEQLRLEQDHVGEEGLYRCKNPHACYVKGRLQLTRSLGDEYLKSAEFNGSKDKHRSGGRFIPDPYTPPYVSHQPDLHHLRLDKQDRFVIIASDGLWDYLSDQEAVEIVASCMPAHMRDAKKPETASAPAAGAVSASVNAAKFTSFGFGAASSESVSKDADLPKWELLAAEKLVQRALEIAAAESGITLAQLKALPIGRARRSRHDDTTAVVMYF